MLASLQKNLHIILHWMRTYNFRLNLIILDFLVTCSREGEKIKTAGKASCSFSLFWVEISTIIYNNDPYQTPVIPVIDALSVEQGISHNHIMI
jgi:hypothetical protein